MQTVETLIDASNQYDGRPRIFFTPFPRKVDQVSSVMASISVTLDNSLIYYSLRYRADMGKFMYSIRSTNGMTSRLLVDDDTEAT